MHVARIAPRSWAQVATSLLPNQNRPGRDLKNCVATPIFRRQPEPCRNIKSVSRRHSGQSRSRPPNGVATPFLLPSPKPGRDTEPRSQPSWRVTYVATSISCRDLVPAHSGISRSRRRNPGRDLPHCYPCRDLKNDVATSNPTGKIPGRPA